jgi:hypothetical protein
MANFYLLGNGFDIHHKLPTRYIDMLHICQFVLDNKETKYELLYDLVHDYVQLTNDSFFNDYLNVYKERLLEIKLMTDDFNRIYALENNCWYKYILACTSSSDKWIDFEAIIQSVLKLFESLFVENEFSLFQDRGKHGGHGDLEFSKSVYVEKLAQYFDNVLGNGDERQQGFLFKSCFWKVDIGHRGYIRYKEKQIVDSLYEHLELFKNTLKYYLFIFVDSVLCCEGTKHQSEHINFFEGFDPKSDYVVSLNYTSVVEHVYNVPRECIHHYHGKLDSHIVLGVNATQEDEFNESLIPNTRFIKFKKYYQRAYYDTDASYLEMTFRDRMKKETREAFDRLTSEYRITNMARNVISFRDEVFPTEKNGRKILVVIGHSLDITDGEIIRKLFEQCELIRVYYHNDIARGDYIENLVRMFGKSEFEIMRTTGRLEFAVL